MVERVEVMVRGWREALAIEHFPGPGDLERLAELFEGRVEICRGPVSGCIHDRAADTAVVFLEEGLEGRALEEALAEELAHALFTLGLALRVRRIDPSSRRIQRLADVCELKDEGTARSFRDAWFLPRELVIAYYDYPYQLAKDSGCPDTWVRRRRGEVWPEVVGIQS